MVSRLSHTTVFVNDIEKAFEFYVNKLGCKVHTDFAMEGGQRWLTVNPPEQPDLELLLVEPSEPMVEREMVPHINALLANNSLGGGVWATADCRETYAELKAKGVYFSTEPKEEFYGVEAIFRDGCGNWWSLTQHSDE